MTVPLYTAAQSRELDRLTIEQGGVAGYELMCRAGAFSFAQLQQFWPHCQSLLVLCGKGNNGGDGYVLAELARQAGMQVRLISAVESESLTGDAYQTYQDCQVAVATSVDQLPLADADVVIDAMLGTGLQGPVTGVYKNWIDQLNAAAVPVLAMDIPSGLCADTGTAQAGAVQATLTTSFISRKQGLYTGQARDFTGHIAFASLGVRHSVYQQVPQAASLLGPEAFSHLPERSPTSYKTSHGHIFVVGGETGTLGAVVLASQAVARAGAGLVSVYTRPEHGPWVTMAQPELMLVGDSWQQASVLVVGPGLGQAEFGHQAWAYCLQQDKPMVVDADGLNLLAAQPQHRHNWILTPHPGEAARLLHATTREVEQDRFAAVSALQAQYGGVVILKGAGSLIADSHGHITVLGIGNAPCQCWFR